MNRIETTLKKLESDGKKALITYITCGDGGYETTEAAVLEMIDSGADIIEIGIPFSERLRKKTDVPLIFMMYMNSIFGFGTERFFEKCAEVGIDGVIVPDLPYEERDEIKDAADKNNVISISLITPASADRIEKIAKDARGFVYCVSSNGVTGMRSAFKTDFESFISEIKKYTDIPCAIGFGISGAKQAAEIKKYCDGIIVGSAIVDIVGKHGKDSVTEIGKLTSDLRQAIDS